MEEYVIVDAIKYKLSYSYPLTLEQRNDTIEQIRKLYGRDKYTSIHENSLMLLATEFPMQKLSSTMHILAPSCAAGSKQKGGTISLNAAPMGGISPYTVTYYKKIGINAPLSIGSQNLVPEATDPALPTTIATHYITTNDDIRYATGDPTPNPTQSPYVSTPLAGGKIRLIIQTIDSCPTGGQTCIEYCDIQLVCEAPVCNFVTT